MHSLERKFALVAVVVFCASFTAWAQPIAVGTGDNHASVVINFTGGANYEFDVAFALASINGLQAFDIIQAGSTLTTVREDFGFGVFVDGIAYDGHSNAGYGGGENWWHYWIREPGQDWTSPTFGAAGRTLINGGADGWVYGSANPPVVTPEPATLGLLAAGGLAMLRRRRAH